MVPRDRMGNTPATLLVLSVFCFLLPEVCIPIAEPQADRKFFEAPHSMTSDIFIKKQPALPCIVQRKAGRSHITGIRIFTCSYQRASRCRRIFHVRMICYEHTFFNRVARSRAAERRLHRGYHMRFSSLSALPWKNFSRCFSEKPKRSTSCTACTML